MRRTPLSNRPRDLIFFDTTSTYFETPFEDGELDGTDEGLRRRGHSKDSRPDLPQVVIGMAVTTGGLPVKLWVWPGDTQDQTVLAEVKADLAGWRLNRTVCVVDAGFTSAANRKVLTGGGTGCTIAQKLRGNEAATVEVRSRQGRFRRGRAPPSQGHPGRRRARRSAVRDDPQPRRREA